MEIKKLLIILIAVFVFIVSGCSSGEEQKIEVQIRVGDNSKYEDLNEIIDHEQVLKVKGILDNIDWEYAKVKMSRFEDYRFVFQYKNPEIEAKTVVFKVWISPYKDKLEVIRGNNGYAQLTKGNSEILYTVITGEKLTDVNYNNTTL